MAAVAYSNPTTNSYLPKPMIFSIPKPHLVSKYESINCDVKINSQNISQNIPLFEFKVSLPNQQYKATKVAPIPFDMRECDGGRFDCINAAFVFIGKHCYFHHNSFTKPLAKMYLPFCRVMKFTTGQYEIPIHLKKAEFEAAFSYAQETIGITC
ncbi:hypothetical protein TRFO_34431 [Tritrichomonas foetus]|uniref:Uncharacterized protein n=1 Tax=Tritrichomonas foetus TaxID=1144522 RepID=A0A1J4JKJ8_9EUKA|nr:hypothetical protein TRFO_34431 [Tritrichomonas foetus]|eukprot:OHS99161.1 hypothetical protein TRFO_34431 [Tritrichomonas foetus]